MMCKNDAFVTKIVNTRLTKFSWPFLPPTKGCQVLPPCLPLGSSVAFSFISKKATIRKVLTTQHSVEIVPQNKHWIAFNMDDDYQRSREKLPLLIHHHFNCLQSRTIRDNYSLALNGPLGATRVFRQFEHFTCYQEKSKNMFYLSSL